MFVIAIWVKVLARGAVKVGVARQFGQETT
jgi:hypothetical protein